MKHAKLINLIVSFVIIFSSLFGGSGLAYAQTSAPPPPDQGDSSNPSNNTKTPADRQEASKRNAAKGLLPGKASSANSDASLMMTMNPVNAVPHFFGPYANYANSPMPSSGIGSITVDDGGSGYTNPVVSILDVYGTGSGATAEAVLSGGTIVKINMITPGAGYSAPIVILSDNGGPGTGATATPNLVAPFEPGSGIRKFVASLPGLGKTGANNIGQYLPVAIPDTTTFPPAATSPGADYYEIGLVQYKERLHPDLPETVLRGYVQLSTSVVPGDRVPLFNPDGTPIFMPDGMTQALGVDTPHYLGPTIVSTKDKPVRILFRNLLPTGQGGNLFLPVDTSVMGSGMAPGMGMTETDPLNPMCNAEPKPAECYKENRATLHLHGGLIPWISDGTPHQWTTPANETTPYEKGVSVQYVPDMWYDVNGNIIPGTEGMTVAPQPGAQNNPGNGALTFYYNNQQSARLMFYHDHAYGITRLNVYAGEAAGYLITDQVEQDLIAGTNLSGIFNLDTTQPGTKMLPDLGIPLIIQDKTFVDANTISAQDPNWRWGTGDIDMNTGMRMPRTGDLWLPNVFMPAQNPQDPTGTNAFGRWQYGPWFWPPTNEIKFLPVPNEYFDPNCDPTQTWCEPPLRPNVPNPSMGMEAFMDTPMVNGTAYPYLEVDPTTVRFRVLNAADDRFFNLHMYVAVDGAGKPCDSGNPHPVASPSGVTCTEMNMVPALKTSGFPATWSTDGRAGGVPDPATRGPSWIQIGTEGGFLPAPAVIPPQPINWNGNATAFNFGNVTDHSLLLGVAERADVLVDFSKYAGKTLIVYNDAPAAFPALDPRYDYYTGDPNQMDTGGAPTTQPGYGPNTRTIMQIRVRPLSPAPAYDLEALKAVFAKTATKKGVFEAGQDPIILPQAAYNSAYNASFPGDNSVYVQIQDQSKTFIPFGATKPVKLNFEMKAIHDEMGAAYDLEYGRMSGMLGLELPGTNNLTQNIILYGYASPPVDLLTDTTDTRASAIGTTADGTQIWKITHNGVDTHPVHFHLVNVQLINRVAWDGVILPPEPNELGWKETIRINPLETTIVAMRPVAPKQPFDIPNSVRLLDPTLPPGAELMGPPGGFKDPALNNVTVTNHLVNFGWEYVYHCHILSHEEMDMMHAVGFAVAPKEPGGLMVVNDASNHPLLTWTDNSLSETEFRIQRAENSGFTLGIKNLSAPLGNLTGPLTYLDTAIDTTTTNGKSYYYRVLAVNVIGDTQTPGFPLKTMISKPSNTAAYGDPTLLPADPTGLTAQEQPGSQVLLGWSDNATNELKYVIERADNGGDFAVIDTIDLNNTTYTDQTIIPGNDYDYRVMAINDAGSSGYTNVASITILPVPPIAPTSLTAALQNGPQVRLVWTDNATIETGFSIERCEENEAMTNCKDPAMNFAEVAKAGALAETGSMSYIDKSVIPGMMYVYQVKAFNLGGPSAPTNMTDMVHIPLPPPPSAPASVTASLLRGPQVLVSWMDAATNETGFIIERCAQPNCTDFTQLSTVPSRAGTGKVVYTDLTSHANTTYQYRVTTVNQGGASLPSDPVAVVIPALPAAPSALSAVLQAGPKIRLIWTDNSYNESAFEIERCNGLNCDAFARIAEPAATNVIGIGSVMYFDVNVSIGNSYTYRVRSVNAAGSSMFSTGAWVNVPLPPVPTSPISLYASKGAGATIKLRWTDRATNEDNFVIERCIGLDCYKLETNFAPIATVSPFKGTGTVTYTDSTVTFGADSIYSYRVKAVNAGGSSRYIGSTRYNINIAVPVPPIPAAPVSLTATLITGPAVRLYWVDRATNETDFIVERSENGGPFNQIAVPGRVVGTGGKYYTDRTIEAGKTYAYRVMAVNYISLSKYSNTSKVVIVPAIPATPTEFKADIAQKVYYDYVTLKWVDQADNELRYTLQRSTSSDFTKGLTITTFKAVPGTGSTMTYLQGLLPRGRTYYYRIQAVNMGGVSPWVNLTVVTP